MLYREIISLSVGVTQKTLCKQETGCLMRNLGVIVRLETTGV